MLIAGGLAHPQCLTGEPPTLGDIGPQRYAREATERLRGEARIAKGTADPKCLGEEVGRAFVVT